MKYDNNMSPQTGSVNNDKTAANTLCLQHQTMDCPARQQLSRDDTLRREVVELTQDVVRHVLKLPSRTSSASRWSRHAAGTMQRVVDDVMSQHSIAFGGMMKRLRVADVEDITSSFQTVVSQMFTDRRHNWGRLVTVFAFAGKLVGHCVQIGVLDADRLEDVDAVSELLGNHIADLLGCWIRDNGGWDEFERFFAQPDTDENLLWRGLLCTAAVGLTAVAAIIAAR